MSVSVLIRGKRENQVDTAKASKSAKSLLRKRCRKCLEKLMLRRWSSKIACYYIESLLYIPIL